MAHSSKSLFLFTYHYYIIKYFLCNFFSQKIFNFTIYHIAKRQPFYCPKSHIHHLPHYNLLRTSNNIIHLPQPTSSDSPLSTPLSHLVFLHLLHKPVRHLIAFLINLMQIFIQLSFKQQLNIISMSELFQILTSHMSILSDIIICSLWQL